MSVFLQNLFRRPFSERINIAETKVCINLNIILQAAQTHMKAVGDPSPEKCPLQLRRIRPTSTITSPNIGLA